MINLSLRSDFNEVVVTSTKVIFMSIILPVILVLNLPKDFLSFIIVGLSCLLSVSYAIFFFGLNKLAKEFVEEKIIVLKNR
ncbi:hypothetical protein [Kriegella aquimaris]|uniref:Uncharacterized protein n=1 Tax=Kriegella aquimaris TaxID=192904 RepID=A0A1G9U6L7_9FLAO|nr:hypothetical protein [Kriegella aquimaris]SDM55205.1 hypothetical protein SAMN04488514_110127 [Kriegella aquimaris]